MNIPPEFFESSRIAPPQSDCFFFERYLRQQPSIRQVLTESGFPGRHHVMDFGCHVGGWAWILSTMCREVTAFDPNSAVIELGSTFAQHNRISNLQYTSSLAAKSEFLDGMVCLTTIQVMTGKKIHSFLDYARSALIPGGILLANSANPGMIIEWIMTLDRVRVEGWQAQQSWIDKLQRCLAMRRIEPIDDSYYCLMPWAFVGLAEEKGFRLIGPPEAYDMIPGAAEFVAINHTVKPFFRRYDWFLFERC